MKLILMLLMVSCSTSQVMLKDADLLPYKESAQLTKVSEKLKPLYIQEVVDKRGTDIYGHAFTGVKYQKTPVYFNKDLAKLTTEFLTDALENRNVVVLEDKEIPLVVEVNKMWVEEVIEEFQPEKAKCRVEVTFHITMPEKKWSGQYWAEFLSGGDLSDGTQRLAPTLASCLNELTEKLVNDQKFISMLK